MTIDVEGATIHLERHGAGEPLLFLHGFTGAGSDWRHLFTEVPAGYELITPDLRGHGRSANPDGRFTFRQSARDVIRILDHLGIDRIKAIGISGGGITLLHLATMAPARIKAMVIVSAPPYFPEPARAVQRHFAESMLSDEERARMRQRHPDGEKQIDALFSQARAFADSYEDVNFTPPLLSTITADTLVVFGDRDPLYPVALALELRAAIPQSYLWVVPNGGHAPVFGAGAPAFVATTQAFLSGHWKSQ